MQTTPCSGFLARDDKSWQQCLESSYTVLRNSWHGEWVGLPWVLNECVRYLGLNESTVSVSASQMLRAADRVAHDIEASFANDIFQTEPLYHNRLHFADAITTVSVQIAIQSQLSKSFNAEWAACALLACIAHDFGHNGRINQFESELEKHSVELLRPILDECGVIGLWRNWTEQCIIQSDFALVQKNHEAVQGAPFDWDLKWLVVFLNESDVMASASTNFGIGMGEALAREWKKIDFVAHKTVATPAGRKGFLKIITFSSPASKELGIHAAIEKEIQSIQTS
jgi:hypothetical protein